MFHRFLFVSASLSAVYACGGTSTRTDDDSAGGSGGAERGGATTGGASTAGGTTTGGVSTAGGAASGGNAASGGFETCDAAPYVGPCTLECSLDPINQAYPECRDGVYQCPGTSVPVSTCQPNSCARRGEWQCCDRLDGKIYDVPCDPMGEQAACEVGMDRGERGAVCTPQDVTVTHCRDLQGRACSGPDVSCHEGTGCGTNGCDCVMDPATGAYTWSCWVLLC